jgi:hypothetical protein
MPSDKLLCPYSVIQSQRVWKKDRAISDPATIFIRDTGKDYSETEKLIPSLQILPYSFQDLIYHS